VARYSVLDFHHESAPMWTRSYKLTVFFKFGFDLAGMFENEDE
jgi:hypothetical protein